MHAQKVQNLVRTVNALCTCHVMWIDIHENVYDDDAKYYRGVASPPTALVTFRVG